MRALIFDGKRARVGDRAVPRPRADEALVRIELAGICNTDLEIARGYMGFHGVLGHELYGVVEDGPREWLGARVVAEINFACGSCEFCAKDLGRHCPTRRVMGILNADGAFAEYAAVPVANLHRVPEGVSDADAVFAEPLAAAFEILEQICVEPGTPCAVLGDGKLGILISQVLSDAGARVLALGRHPEKLAILGRRDIETQLVDAWTPRRFPLVVEATGSEAGFRLAVQITAPRGQLVLKSTIADSPRIDLAPLVIDEIQVVGSRCGPFQPALDALAEGRIDVASLVGQRESLARADEGLRRAGERGMLKILLECS